MYINLESTEKHSIEAYSDHEIRINAITYQQNLIVSSTQLITPWLIENISHLDEANLAPLVALHPNILLIGHANLNLFPPTSSRQILAKQNIALECMSIAAACRTFNILLNEQRNVVLGIIF